MLRTLSFALALAVLIAAPFALRAQGADGVSALNAEVVALYEAQSAGHRPAPVRARLAEAFDTAGVGFSRRYIDSWTTILTDRWMQHDAFFATQQISLADWTAAVDAGVVSEAEALEALAPALAAIRTVAARLPEWTEDDVARLVERARWTDLANEVGCCDPLYYHALGEAEAVWSRAASPAPAALAALELVPTVPGPSAPEGSVADRAYDWLAARAQILALDRDAAPADRRALLVEAGLLADLFGLPDETVASGDALAQMTAREGFAAMPTAQLLRLAAITEPGRLHDLLLEEASMRLQARADHLRPILAERAEAPGLARRDAEAEQEREAEMADAAPAAGSAVALGTRTIAPSAAPRPAAPAVTSPADSAEQRAVAAIDQALSVLGTGEALDASALLGLAEAAERADALLQPTDTLELLAGLGQAMSLSGGATLPTQSMSND